MDWPIQHIARIAGTTSRTLRHYDDVGLLRPTRVGQNGYRYYDSSALVRLQRILLLRELGLGLTQIRELLDRDTTEAAALEKHLAWLHEEQRRLARQVASVQATIDALRGGEELMAEKMFDGFDHTQYREEVEQRWGADAYERSDRWWRGMSDDERADWKALTADLGRDWTEAAKRGIDPRSEEAQALADRHIAWLRSIPGTPGRGSADELAQYVRGLEDMYVDDPRFAANYGGAAGAEFVRAALRHRVDSTG